MENATENLHSQRKLLVEKIRKIIKELIMLEQHYTSVEKDKNSAENSEETLAGTDEPSKILLEIEGNVEIINAKLDMLQINSKNDNYDNKNDNEIGLLRDLCCNILEEVSTQNCVQNAVSEDLQRQLREKDEQRLQLLNDLKQQEEAHLQKIEEIRMQNKSELEDRDMCCLQLRETIERLQSDNDINLSCSICMERWNPGTEHRLVCLPCGHLFGSTCIYDYLQRCYMCPNCRAPTNVSGMRYIYGRPY